MKPGIRTRLLVIIGLATLVPLLIAVLGIQTIGYRHLVKERGSAFQAGAMHVADNIEVLAHAEMQAICDFIKLDGLQAYVVEANRALEGLSDAELQKQIEETEARWPTLRPADSQIARFLDNPLAARVRAFRVRHPLFAEILVTDRKGRLIASTGKTSDYWQADELWWQKAVALREGRTWIEGLQFDQSSGTFSLDISVPIRSPEGNVLGALKGSIDASPLFSSVSPVLAERSLTRDVVRSDGAVLLRLYETNFVPSSLGMAPRLIQALQRAETGWTVQTLFEEKSLVGFAALRIRPLGTRSSRSSGLAEMFVVVHEPAAIALRPLRKQVTFLTLSGGALFLVFGGAGLWIATRRIIQPVTLLRAAADAVAATVHPRDGTDGELVRRASAQLTHLSEIRTGDELETLAGDFEVMGRRVLRYQQQLEEEIAAKTATIQRDLDMAREFQTALMPSSYPVIPEGECPDQLSLSFHHVYKPAATVGGDFFDVLKLSDHQAGVFIADVMGHGARSALVTAILRTLLQTHSNQAEDPATLLSLVNREFHQLTLRTRQTLFVTAFYMVVDTLKRTLACVSAGHPSPLLAQRSTGSVRLLFSQFKVDPAIGLFPTASYSNHSHPLEPGDLILLYTDGVAEAIDSAGNEFGVDGLIKVLKSSLAAPNGTAINFISQELAKFVGPEPFADDVCLVTIETGSGLERPARGSEALSEPASTGL